MIKLALIGKNNMNDKLMCLLKNQQGGSLTSLLDILFSAFGAVIVMTIIFSARINNPSPSSFVEMMIHSPQDLPLEIEIKKIKSGYQWLWLNGELNSSPVHQKQPIISSGTDFTHLLLQDLSVGEYTLKVSLMEPPLSNMNHSFELAIRQTCQTSSNVRKMISNHPPSLTTPLFEESFEVKVLEETCAGDE